MTGYASFLYDDPWTLWRELLPEYQGRVNAIGRRTETLSLGTYTLKEFKEFYAALLAVCAAHEFLCFAWGQGSSKIYPVGSAVMVRSNQAWAEILSDLSNVAVDKCKSIISDLSFDCDRSVVPANPDHIDRLGVVAYYSIAVRALVHGANRLTFRLFRSRAALQLRFSRCATNSESFNAP